MQKLQLWGWHLHFELVTTRNLRHCACHQFEKSVSRSESVSQSALVLVDGRRATEVWIFADGLLLHFESRMVRRNSNVQSFLALQKYESLTLELNSAKKHLDTASK